MPKNASNRGRDFITLKNDTIDLELCGGEFRNGNTVKNGASENIGGSPMLSFLLLLHRGR